jgi:hypothetical protein
MMAPIAPELNWRRECGWPDWVNHRHSGQAPKREGRLFLFVLVGDPRARRKCSLVIDATPVMGPCRLLVIFDRLYLLRPGQSSTAADSMAVVGRLAVCFLPPSCSICCLWWPPDTRLDPPPSVCRLGVPLPNRLLSTPPPSSERVPGRLVEGVMVVIQTDNAHGWGRGRIIPLSTARPIIRSVGIREPERKTGKRTPDTHSVVGGLCVDQSRHCPNPSAPAETPSNILCAAAPTFSTFSRSPSHPCSTSASSLITILLLLPYRDQYLHCRGAGCRSWSTETCLQLDQ